MIINECVLDVASQVGGAAPGLVTTYDKSRFHNDGTLTNVTWAQLGDGQWVASMVGTGNIDCGTDNSLDFTTEAFTIMTWLYWDAAVADLLYCKGLDATDGLYVMVQADGRIDMYTADALTSRRTSSAAGGLTIAAWSRVVFTRSGTTGLIYKNGVDITVVSGTHNNITTSARNAYWGQYDTGGQRLNGDLGLNKILNYALTPAQVRADFHKTKWMFGYAN